MSQSCLFREARTWRKLATPFLGAEAEHKKFVQKRLADRLPHDQNILFVRPHRCQQKQYPVLKESIPWFHSDASCSSVAIILMVRYSTELKIGSYQNSALEFGILNSPEVRFQYTSVLFSSGEKIKLNDIHLAAAARSTSHDIGRF